MSKMYWLLPLAALMTGLFAASGLAEDKKGKEDKKAEERKVVEESATTKGLKALNAADTLVRIGRDAKSPQPLLLLAAARVIGGTDVEKVDVKDAKLESKSEDYDTLKEAVELIAEARKLAGKDETIEAVAKKVEAEIKERKRGEERGPQVRKQLVDADFDKTDTFFFAFRGGEPAVITVNNTRNRGDIDLFVYNAQTGALIVKDDSGNPDAAVAWTPSARVRVRVVVKAYRGHRMWYVLRTN